MLCFITQDFYYIVKISEVFLFLAFFHGACKHIQHKQVDPLAPYHLLNLFAQIFHRIKAALSVSM